MVKEILIKRNKLSKPQILAILRQAEEDIRVPEFCPRSWNGRPDRLGGRWTKNLPASLAAAAADDAGFREHSAFGNNSQ